jgi:hypothetical protein
LPSWLTRGRVKLWDYEEIERPELPIDLRDFGSYGNVWRMHGDKMRKDAGSYASSELTDDMTTRLNGLRQTLWNMLSDEQKATWYHFGFIEIKEWRSREGGMFRAKHRSSRYMVDGFYRIHHRGSSGLASVIDGPEGRAMTGLCCYQPYREFEIENTISNVLALRTDNTTFEMHACSNSTVEQLSLSTYDSKNARRIQEASRVLREQERESEIQARTSLRYYF